MNEGTVALREHGRAITREPRPLFNRRGGGRKINSDEDDLMELLKAQIVQDGIRRDEEHQRREQERKDREDERQIEREHREEETKRHEQFMQMILFFIFKMQFFK